MADYAVLVGINRYPYPNSLRGCVNDVHDVRAELIHGHAFRARDITALCDGHATAQAIKLELATTVGKLKAGDRFLFWYSGHGAQMVDGNAGTDVICPVDFDWYKPESHIGVKDFHTIFAGVPSGVVGVWGSDSCHSGDLDRGFCRLGAPRGWDHDFSRDTVKPASADVEFETFKSIAAALPNLAFMSGCRSDQTSADAFIEGKYNGAFTASLLRALREAPGSTIKEAVLLTRAVLTNSHYDQIPQVWGPDAEINRQFMGK